MKQHGAQYWHSPLGWILIETSGGKVRNVRFVQRTNNGLDKRKLRHGELVEPGVVFPKHHPFGPSDPANGRAGKLRVTYECVQQLHEYFSGKRRTFDLPLALEGTVFQKHVWEAVWKIPCGSVATYADIARAIGRPRAARAVGNALKNNPIAILIPCHRVVPAGGKAGGYAWGAHRKKQLLSHEATCAMIAA